MKLKFGTNKIVLNTILSFMGLWIPFLWILIKFLISDSNPTKVLMYFFLLVLFFVFNSLFNNKYLHLFLLLLFTSLFSFFSFIDIAYASLFNNNITASTIYIILETNANESKEFLSMYMTPQFMLIASVNLAAVIIGVIISNFRYSYINEFRNRYLPKRRYLFIILIISHDISSPKNIRAYTSLIS